MGDGEAVRSWIRGRGHALGWLTVLAVAATVTACGAPQFTYISDSSASTYFKVPFGWHKISGNSLAAQFGGNGKGGLQPGVWEVGYDAAPAPSATHALSPTATKPFVLALVFPLNPVATNALSYNGLRDIMLPVTTAGRQAAASRGFPLTGFRLLRDSVLMPGQGVHGVRDTFIYTYPDGATDTFDQVAFTNSNDTQVYLLLVHCLATCYHQSQQQIDTVMSSFTVRNP